SAGPNGAMLSGLRSTRHTTLVLFGCGPIPLVLRFLERVLHHPAMLCRQLLGPELDGHFGELTGEAERNLVILVVDRRAQVDADIEGLVDRHEKRDRVWDLFVGDRLSIHAQDARAALAEAGPVVGELECDLVFAGRERLWSLPPEPFEIHEVVREH